MTDLTSYGADALSDIVHNDEYFYVERQSPEFLLSLVEEEFHYTEDQKQTLIYNLKNYNNEKI